MPQPHERRRLLAAACPEYAPILNALFRDPVLAEWELAHADSLAHSRFIVQHNPCDALLVSSRLVEHEGGHGLAWLAQRSERPIVYLTGNDADDLRAAYQYGINICVPEALVANAPQLLAAALNRALAGVKQQRQNRQLFRQLKCSRRHVDRLVSLIWRTMPVEPFNQWYPQRFALERLQEELARTQRHAVPLSVAIGEVAATQDNSATANQLANVLTRVKRRSDVVGQYGLNGFILVMLHTGKEGGIACCQRIRHFLEASAKEPAAKRLQVYFGVSSTVEHEPTAQSLLRWAEHNLELAKRGEHDRIAAI